MLFKRVEGRIDINNEIQAGNIVVNEEEQRGARTNKFWFNNYEYMYKDVYQLTYEDYAEIIAHKLAEQLGLECAKYDLAIFNGNRGVITENLIKDNENEEMLSGTEIISMVYTEYFLPILNVIEKYHETIKQKTIILNKEKNKLKRVILLLWIILCISPILDKELKLTTHTTDEGEIYYITLKKIVEKTIFFYINLIIDF